MKLNDVILEAASPAQQAAIAISMKKAGKKPKQGVAEGSASQVKRYSGKPEGYTFSRVQQKNYDMLVDILARNGMKFTKVDAQTYPGQRSYIDRLSKSTPIMLTTFIVKSPALEWHKYEGLTAGGGQNTVKVGVKKMKLTDFLRLDPKQQDALLKSGTGVAEGSSESVSLRDMVNVVDRHYPKYYAELSGSDISDRQFERAIVNAYKKIMQKQGVAEGSDTYKQGHAKFHTKTNKQVGPTHYGRSSDKKADSYTKADPRYHEVRPVKEQGVAEGSEEDMSKEANAMATGKCPHCHGPVQKKEHPTLTQYHCAKCGIRASIDKQGVAEGSGPKEKQKTPYRDINSPEYRAAADKQKQRMAKDKAAEPGKKLLAKQGVAEDAVSDFIARGGQIQQGKLHKPRKGETWQGSSHIGAAGGRGTKGTVSGKAANTNPKGGKPVVSAEGYNPEYDDEAGMADNNLETLQRAVEGIDDLIQSGDNLPEWCQEKIAVAKSMLVAVWDYMYSEEASDEVDPEVDEMFEAMQELVAEMAVKNRVSEDLVWEQFEAMPDNVLYETAAWRRKEGKSKKGGLNAKGVASYRRENPGSKLQMAVTTKPSKLKKGSKAAKRRKSFCARMSGVKGPMKKPNGKPTRKALALRKWNC